MFIKSALAAVAFMMSAAVFAASPALAVAAGWTAPVELSAAGGEASGQQVVVDANGLATAVWERFDGVSVFIQSSTSLNGGTWSTPVDVSLAGQNGSSPQVVVDAAGLATAVWRSFDGTNYSIQSSTSLSGGPWSVPVNLVVTTTEAFKPQAAVTASGRVTAVWYSFNGANTLLIRSSTSLTGGSWSTPVTLSEAGQNAFSSEVAVNASGLITAIWQRDNGVNFIIQASTSLNGVSWSEPEDLSEVGESAYYPQVAIDASGLATAVWNSSSGSSGFIQSRTSLNGGSWTNAVNVSAVGQSAFRPQVAIDASGRVTAVWIGYNGTNDIIQSSISLSPGSWSTPVGLSAVGQDAYNPQVVEDASGLLTTVWHRSNGSHDIIQSSTSLNGVLWSTPVDLSEVGQSAFSPQVAVNASGLVASVWDRFNGTNDIIQSSTLDNRVAPTPPAPELAATGVDTTSGALLAGGAFLAVMSGAILVVSRQRKKSL